MPYETQLPDDVLDVPTMAPGVYFGLSEEDYHADMSLSASGIKNLKKGSIVFWRDSSMNPEREREERDHLNYGTAIHKLILEGEDSFFEGYYFPPAKDDHPDALDKSDEYKAALRGHGLKLSGTKYDMKSRLLEAKADVRFWDDIQDAAATANAGKKPVSLDWWRKMKTTSEILKRHPVLSKAFVNGYPEVSVFWKWGNVPMKARIDYLRLKGVVDLKSFSPQHGGGNIEQSMRRAVINNGYHIPAAVYTQATIEAKKLIAKGAVFGDVDQEWLSRFQAKKIIDFMLVFVEVNTWPAVGAMRLPAGDDVMSCGFAAAKGGLADYENGVKTWGHEVPWIDQSSPVDLSASDLPNYFFEG